MLRALQMLVLPLIALALTTGVLSLRHSASGCVPPSVTWDDATHTYAAYIVFLYLLPFSVDITSVAWYVRPSWMSWTGDKIECRQLWRLTGNLGINFNTQKGCILQHLTEYLADSNMVWMQGSKGRVLVNCILHVINGMLPQHSYTHKSDARGNRSGGHWHDCMTKLSQIILLLHRI